MKFNQLSTRQLDTLKELSNIGMGTAATALSQLINQTVLLQVPQVLVSEIAEVPDLIGGAESEVVGIAFQIMGDAQGSILMTFPIESANKLGRILLNSGDQEFVSSPLGVSTLKEVGNILASAFLNGLGNQLQMTLIPSIPLLAHDMAGAIVDHVLIELGKEGDLALTMEAEFYDTNRNADATINCQFFLLPDPASLEIIFRAVGLADG